jgi:RNA recognition motif-containing protein
LGNVPPDTTAEQILNHVRSGIIENLKQIPEKNCAFVCFLDHSSAAHFHADAVLKKLTINGQEIKIGWGRSSLVPTAVSLAVAQEGASRNVYLGNLPDDVTQEDIRKDLLKFGQIDTIKLVKEKNIGFVHFLSISTAIRVVAQLPHQPNWAGRKVYYGKDRCAYISKTQQQNAAQYLGITPGYEHILANVDRDLLSSALAQQSAAAVAVATAAGGPANIGNRTIYLGNVHPETSTEEICNVVRGGLLQNIRYIPERHICFVTFIDPTAAAQFYAMANIHGLSIHNRRLKVGWGKHSGPIMNAISLAVTAGATRNVYIGNIDDNWPESKLRHDFSEFGEIEQINFLPEKSCAFVNFTDITNAIKAIEGIKEKEEYKQFKINFGKDRCGNPPRFFQQQLAQMRNDNTGGSPGSDDSAKRSESATTGNHLLAQYLSQAQHEQYMYAAAMAAAADQARYQAMMSQREYAEGEENDDEENDDEENDDEESPKEEKHHEEPPKEEKHHEEPPKEEKHHEEKTHEDPPQEENHKNDKSERPEQDDKVVEPRDDDGSTVTVSEPGSADAPSSPKAFDALDNGSKVDGATKVYGLAIES